MAPKTRRKSAFQEVGLLDSALQNSLSPPPPTRRERPQSVRFRSKDEVHLVERLEDVVIVPEKEVTPPSIDRGTTRRYISLDNSPLPTSWSSWMMYRFGAILVIFAALVPLLQATELFGHSPALPIRGARGAVLPEQPWPRAPIDLEKRADSPASACFRWAQMSAVVNGTLYLYGGQATTSSDQTQNTWNNDFLTIDLTKTWQIGGPPLKGLPQPDGPPAVALGYLWNSYDSLFLYGGEFSWKPPVTPTPFSTWEYQIGSQQWVEHSDPVTSAGQSAPDNGVSVQRSAEGAGANVPSLGRGFYFGGHQDGYTTPGWDQSIPRVYLQSLLEYTFPGFSNPDVTSLKNGQAAGDDGVYRNITVGGLQADAGFTQRADGLLIYIPGFGDEGILLALAGGTNDTFTQMNNVNVFDIATSSWYTQATSGDTPKIRVNPCAVTAVAQDGSSYNIYMFGGQNLTPYAKQTQYDDMWILTLPTFTWIKVDQGGSVPYGRSGATCNIWDAQMVMVGGYIGDQPLTCESPGIYVFDLSNLQWVNQFTALSASPDGMSEEQNPLNQQPNQRSSDNSPGGLEGSYGYEVPDAVISVIGGGKTGGATLTTPVVTATGGPLKTGSPVTYTVTSSNGVVTTETAASGNSGSSGTTESSGGGGPNIAAIVVGVICGLLFVLICYLLFCLYLYRKQLALYKRHVEMSQRQARGEKPPAIPGLWAAEESDGTSQTRHIDDNGNLAPAVGSSKAGSGGGSNAGSGAQGSGSSPANGSNNGYQSVRRNSDGSDTEDLLAGQEPTFVGVMLHPRRSLRVTNRD